METSSYFIENLALFGPFPEQSWVRDLESQGVTHFINLTYSREKLTYPYTVGKNSTIINFPIMDKNIPTSTHDFCKFIINIIAKLHELKHKKEKMYIHCKGGHGRSGMVVACILVQWLKLTDPEIALQLTTKYRNSRPKIKEKYLYQSSPQMNAQKNFVRAICKNIKITPDHPIGKFLINTPINTNITQNTYNGLLDMALNTNIVMSDEGLKEYYNIIIKIVKELISQHKELEIYLSRPNIGVVTLFDENSDYDDCVGDSVSNGDGNDGDGNRDEEYDSNNYISSNPTTIISGRLLNLALLNAKNNLVCNRVRVKYN